MEICDESDGESGGDGVSNYAERVIERSIEDDIGNGESRVLEERVSFRDLKLDWGRRVVH
jgi:hypothetical protein